MEFENINQFLAVIISPHRGFKKARKDELAGL
jgi:hypothetical protein